MLIVLLFSLYFRWASGVVDISKPEVSSCKSLSQERVFGNRTEGISDYVFAPDLEESLRSGPVVATIRLTWEFQEFTGSLFNPEGKQTFCRESKEGDKNDYCDPTKTPASDTAQLNQQKSDAPDDTWYNHFVTLHGWGVKNGVKYWVVETSWGRIYDNDPEVDNNGAGKAYKPFFYRFDEKGEKRTIHDKKNHFVLIADRVAGKGGLEMTTRDVYYPFLTNETMNGNPKNDPQDEVVLK